MNQDTTSIHNKKTKSTEDATLQHVGTTSSQSSERHRKKLRFFELQVLNKLLLSQIYLAKWRVTLIPSNERDINRTYMGKFLLP